MATYREIEIFRIETSRSGRKILNLREIKNLYRSIKEVGLIYPIIVKKQLGANKYIIIDGYKRFKVYQRLYKKAGFKFKKIPCLIYDVKDSEISMVRLIETSLKEKLPYYDEALLACRLLQKNAFNYKETAELIGRSSGYIKRMEKYFQCISQLENLIDDRFMKKLYRLSPKKVIAMSKLNDEKWIGFLVAQIIEEGLSLKMIKTLVKIINSGEIPDVLSIRLTSLQTGVKNGYKANGSIPTKEEQRQKKNQRKTEFVNNVNQIKTHLNQIKDWCANPGEKYQVSLLFSEVDILLDEINR